MRRSSLHSGPCSAAGLVRGLERQLRLVNSLAADVKLTTFSFFKSKKRVTYWRTAVESVR